MADAVDELFEGLPVTLSTTTTAEILGLSKKGLYDLLDRGIIPAYRLGGRWYVIRDELKRTLREGSNLPSHEGITDS